MRSDAEILKAIAQTESGGDPNAIGKSGEIGQYQFMPDTIKALGGDASKLKGNAAAQDELARKHLASLRAKYGEDDNKVIAAWNAGEGGVDNAVKKGGSAWQQALPKGTNKFGAQYDTGAYVQRVNQNFSQETATPTETQQPNRAVEPQPQQPSPIPMAVAGGPEQTLAEAYHTRRKAELMNWMMQGAAPAEATPAPEKPAEQPKPEGGLINAIGSGVKSLASAISGPGKALADALYPAHPQGRGGRTLSSLITGQQPPSSAADQGVVENVIGSVGRAVGAGVQTMKEGVAGTKELLAPSAEESARRQAAPISEQLMGLLRGVGDAFNATPAGGVVGAAESVGRDVGAAVTTPDLSDAAITARIAQLEKATGPEATVSPEMGAEIGGGNIVSRAEETAGLRRLLMIPADQRVEKASEAFGHVFGGIAGVAPMPFTLGAFGALKGMVSGSKEAAVGVKAARQAVIAQAAQSAAAPVEHAAAAPAARAAEGAAVKPTAPKTLADIRQEMAPESTPGVKAGPSAPGSIPENMMTMEKLGLKSPGAQRLAAIEQDPAARQVINEVITENAPPPISGGSGATLEAPAAQQGPVARIVEDVNFQGKSQRAALGPNDNMVVALDKDGKDMGYLWYTREPGGGYTVRKIETAPEYRRQGVAKKLDQAVMDAEGPYLGATDQTPEGKAFRKSREQVAPEQMYREVRDVLHGDPDLTQAALESRGYTMPPLGEKEAAAVSEAMGVAKNAAPAEKAAAEEALRGIASDLGVLPEVGTEALPAINKVVKALGEGNLKSIREIIGAAMKDVENPLSALRAAQGAGSEAGRVNAGTLFVVARAALGGVLGGMTGDDPSSHIRNVLLGAGIGAVLSPKLAGIIAENIMKPEVRETLKNALTLHGEEGALRFPARGVGRNPSPNTENMGVGTAAKRVVRGINEQLEKLNMLARAEEQTHAATKTAARHSEYSTVEKVLSLDSAKLSPDELAAAGLASRNVRDAISEKVIESAARARLNPGDAGLEEEFMNQMALLAKTSQQTTNLETAFARATNALGIETDITAASKFDLKQFAGDVEMFKGALTDQGKVSTAQLAEMVGTLAEKAAAAKLATVASKWPPALWNIYYGLNLLSSPLTHMRNIIGNTGALGMAVVDRAGGEILGGAYRLAGYKGATVAPGETYHMLAGMYDIVADSFRAAVPKGDGAFGIAKDAYTTGLSKFEGGNKYTEAIAAATAQQAQQAGEGTLPWVVQTMSNLGAKNMKAMSGVDEFFKVLSFQGEMRSLAHRATQHLEGAERLEAFQRAMGDPTTAMLHGAEEFARENTFTKAFTQDGAFGGLGAKVETVAQSTLMKLVATPFFRTPMRIGEFSTVHTPLLNALAPQTWADMAAGGVKQQLAISKVMTGTAMMGMTAWYAAHGYITGAAPSDPKLRQQLEATGWQEFSFYLPGLGKYVSYANIEPISTIVGTMATFTQSAPDLDEMTIQNFFSGGVLAVSKNMLNKQWWQGLSDMSDMLASMYKDGNAKSAVTWLARKTAAAIPGGSISRYVNNATDPVKHEPEINEWKNLADIYAQNTPGWGGRNALELVGYKPRPAAINGITGEVVPNENQWIGLAAPFRVSSLKNDPVLEKLVELGGAQLPKDLIPKVLAGSAPASPFKLSGQEEEQRAMKEGVTLSNEQRDRLGKLMTKEVKDRDGNTMHEAMAEAIRDPDFADEKGGPDGGQAHRLASIYHDFLKEASEKLREEYPDIDIAIMRRKLERDGRRFPKSMDWLLNEGRQELQQEAASRGAR